MLKILWLCFCGGHSGVIVCTIFGYSYMYTTVLNGLPDCEFSQSSKKASNLNC